jgi:hypothetical protein
VIRGKQKQACFNLKIMEITMNSTMLQGSQVETISQDITSTKATKKSLSAHWVMEDGKLICKWTVQ